MRGSPFHKRAPSLPFQNALSHEGVCTNIFTHPKGAYSLAAKRHIERHRRWRHIECPQDIYRVARGATYRRPRSGLYHSPVGCMSLARSANITPPKEAYHAPAGCISLARSANITPPKEAYHAPVGCMSRCARCTSRRQNLPCKFED